MPSPSQLAIATSSVQRLIKEEASYYKELTKQEARLQQTERAQGHGDADENADFTLRQEVCLSLPCPTLLYPPLLYLACPT